MTKNLHKNLIFSQSECLSPGQLAGYLNNKLSAQERRLVEHHLVDCPLCSEAVEGLATMDNPSDIIDIAADLNRLIAIRTQSPRVRTLTFRRLAVAASIVFLASVGLFLYFN